MESVLCLIVLARLLNTRVGWTSHWNNCDPESIKIVFTKVFGVITRNIYWKLPILHLAQWVLSMELFRVIFMCN